jgi:hypothetical protein
MLNTKWSQYANRSIHHGFYLAIVSFATPLTAYAQGGITGLLTNLQTIINQLIPLAASLISSIMEVTAGNFGE